MAGGVLASFGMNLASAKGKTGGGGSDRLKTSKTAWTTAASSVGKLEQNVSTAKTKLTEGQKGVGAGDTSGAGGVKSAVAQRDVYDSWKTYLTSVAGRCTGLQSQLQYAANNFAEYETDVATGFNMLVTSYADTPALGGKGKG
ncbi:hypothetical protein LRS74_11405 [Streptomyces sp. LX-29]|uniref:hypothetical protein n=1 Tax=Streptomyces sp. LX-29 TaxID=2900152 RepID=UPI00240E90F9|nr:hypothetical protein [Streptomyces sp. LX-29]WFB07592.1 hypothetical protein LRS74_11405 [Streptomyces sp. LX-29]